MIKPAIVPAKVTDFIHCIFADWDIFGVFFFLMMHEVRSVFENLFTKTTFVCFGFYMFTMIIPAFFGKVTITFSEITAKVNFFYMGFIPVDH